MRRMAPIHGPRVDGGPHIRVDSPAVKLLVVIVNYRVTDLTIDCLRSWDPEIHRVPSARVAVCENGTAYGARREWDT